MAINIFLAELLKKSTRGGGNLPPTKKNRVKKQPYQLLNTNRQFFPSFDASNVHKLVYESS